MTGVAGRAGLEGRHDRGPRPFPNTAMQAPLRRLLPDVTFDSETVGVPAPSRIDTSALRDPRNITVWVTVREAFWIAMEALRSHKLRSFLTLLGVVIATTTLIVVMSTVNGMNLYIADHIANLGTNTFVLHQFQWAQGFDSFLKARRRNKPIRMEDYEFLKENLQGY